MARKKKAQECPAGEKWAVPYADFLSLLLALFIALWAISDSNPSKTTAIATEFIKIFDFPKTVVLPGQKSGGMQNTNDDELEGGSMKSASADSEFGDELMSILDQKEMQIALNLPTSIPFESASYEIKNPDIINFINILALTIKKMPPVVKVEVRGYADDFSDDFENFKLASKRAYEVTRLLNERGIDVKTLSYSAFASILHKDKKDNKSVQIYFKVDKNDKKTQKSVLDLISK